MITPRKILLIEDQEADQFIARRNIGRRWPEAELLCALDGQEAIEVLEASWDSLPELILLDINMPRMNGHEFLRAWSKLHDNDIPVVVMLTSSDQRTDRENAEQYSFVRDYIIKPLSQKTVASLDAVLSAL